MSEEGEEDAQPVCQAADLSSSQDGEVSRWLGGVGRRQAMDGSAMVGSAMDGSAGELEGGSAGAESTDD